METLLVNDSVIQFANILGHLHNQEICATNSNKAAIE